MLAWGRWKSAAGGVGFSKFQQGQRSLIQCLSPLSEQGTGGNDWRGGACGSVDQCPFTRCFSTCSCLVCFLVAVASDRGQAVSNLAEHSPRAASHPESTSHQMTLTWAPNRCHACHACHVPSCPVSLATSFQRPSQRCDKPLPFSDWLGVAVAVTSSPDSGPRLSSLGPSVACSSRYIVEVYGVTSHYMQYMPEWSTGCRRRGCISEASCAESQIQPEQTLH